MDIISIKLDESLSKEMEKVMKPLYTTKTEFIREAIRDKIHEEKKKQFTQKLQENFGKGKHYNTTDEDLEKIREEVGNKYLKKFGLD